MVQNMDRNTGLSENSYISCIKINGKPILPPLMTPERRLEMVRYRELAIAVEAQLQRWARQYGVKRTSVDSGVTLSSSDQTPNENVEDVMSESTNRGPREGSTLQLETSTNSQKTLRTTQKQNSSHIVGNCNEAAGSSAVMSYFEGKHAAKVNEYHNPECQIRPDIKDSILNFPASIFISEYSGFKPWEKIKVHGKDTELPKTCMSDVRSRKTWQIPHHNATISELKGSFRQKWDKDKDSLCILNRNYASTNAEHDRTTIEREQESTLQIRDGKRKDSNFQETMDSVILKLPSSKPHTPCEPEFEPTRKHAYREIPTLEGFLENESRPVKICEGVMDLSKNLQSELLVNNSSTQEQANAPFMSSSISPETNRASNSCSSNLQSELLGNKTNARINSWEEVKTPVASAFTSPEPSRASNTSSSTLQSAHLGNNHNTAINSWEQVKSPVASAVTSPETGRVSIGSNSTFNFIAHDSVDESTGSVALTSSTDLNYYMNVTGSSGSGSPGRDPCPWLGGPLQRSAALASVTKSYPSRQELLLASFSDPNLCPENQQFGDNKILQNLNNNPTRIEDSNLKESYVMTPDKPAPQGNSTGNDKLPPSGRNLVELKNCSDYVPCTNDFRITSNDRDELKCLTIPDIKLQNNKQPLVNSETTKGSCIPIYKQLHSPPCSKLKSQTEEDDTKREVSPPRLVRQNSYTLDSPSPLLIAHIETQKGKKSTHDMTESSNMSSKTSNKSSDSFQTKKSDSGSKKGNFSSPSSRMKVNRKSSCSSANSYTNSCLSRVRDRKNCSLPASKTNSPIKLYSPFKSLDCLPSAVSKEPGKLMKQTSTPSKRKESCKSSASSTRKEMTNAKASQKNSLAKKNLSMENISIKQNDKSASVNEDNKNVQVKKDAENVVSQKNYSNSSPKQRVKDITEKDDCKHVANEEGNKSETNSGHKLVSGNVSQQDLHGLVVRLQSEHSQQMAELLSKQRKEQEEMHRAFVEQQSQLMLEIYKICPEVFSSNEAEKLNNLQTFLCSNDNQHAISPSNRSASVASASTPPTVSHDNNATSSNICLNMSNEKEHDIGNGQAEDITYDDASNISGPSVNTSAFETNNGRSSVQNEMQNVNLSDAPEGKGIDAGRIPNGGCLEDENVMERLMVQHPLLLGINGNIAAPEFSPSNRHFPQREESVIPEMEMEDNTRNNSNISCSRQLFPVLERKMYAPATRAEIEKMAATRITAAVKGYLTRRLFRTARVQEIILTIRDTLLCAVQINQDCWSDITPEDVELHRRLIHQVTAACHALHEVFFGFSTAEKMAIIAVDRERLNNQAPKTPAPRPLSAATRRALERKMLQRVERRPQSAEPRLCRVRSLGFSRNPLSRSYDVGQNCLMREHQQAALQGLNKARRSMNINGARRPWRPVRALGCSEKVARRMATPASLAIETRHDSTEIKREICLILLLCTISHHEVKFHVPGLEVETLDGVFGQCFADLYSTLGEDKGLSHTSLF